VDAAGRAFGERRGGGQLVRRLRVDVRRRGGRRRLRARGPGHHVRGHRVPVLADRHHVGASRGARGERSGERGPARHLGVGERRHRPRRRPRPRDREPLRRRRGVRVRLLLDRRRRLRGRHEEPGRRLPGLRFVALRDGVVPLGLRRRRHGRGHRWCRRLRHRQLRHRRRSDHHEHEHLRRHGRGRQRRRRHEHRRRGWHDRIGRSGRRRRRRGDRLRRLRLHHRGGLFAAARPRRPRRAARARGAPA
jgi:hypothetical protein